MSNKQKNKYMPTNGKFPTWEHFIPNVGIILFFRGNFCEPSASCS